jgi:two-component system sensor histidine kinase KdpD
MGPARTRPSHFLGAAAVVALCSAAVALLDHHFDLVNLTMIYLLGVVIVAILLGRAPAIFAAITSVAVFDFVFVPPRFTFEVDDTQYLVAFSVMLLVAVVTATLTSRLREQREEARVREARSTALYRLGHDLAIRGDEAEVVSSVVTRLRDLFGGRVAILMPDAAGDLATSGGDAAILDTQAERDAASWAYRSGVPSGLASAIHTNARGLFVPLVAGAKNLGVLALRPEGEATGYDPARLDLLRALASLSALAIARCRLAEDSRAARVEVETERSRNALLQSVSHDLRTPLASITGAATGLRDGVATLTEAAKHDLADTIAEEAERLNRLIGNILDMTRLDSGSLRVRKEWHSLEEVLGAALTRLEPQLGARSVRVAGVTGLPLVPLDDVLFEQVVRNLIENAQKYSPPETPIEIGAAVEGAWLRLDVADRGPGVPSGEETRLFEKFYRAPNAFGRPGAGLGLTICKGFVEAHGGTLTASPRDGGGLVFTVRLPLEGEPPVVEAEDGSSRERGPAR